MIWSDAVPAPNVRYVQPAPAVPSAWPLEELHAMHDGEVFHAESEAPAALTPAEMAAQHDAERAHAAAAAYQEGYTAGLAAAHREADGMMASAMAALQAAAADLAGSESRFVGALEDNLAALAVSVARQIITREVRTTPEVIVDLVRRAVQEFPVDQPLRIRVNPLDLSTLAVAPDGRGISIAPGREIGWVADARIYPGGCVVEGRERIIDGRVDTALERVYRTLTDSAA